MYINIIYDFNLQSYHNNCIIYSNNYFRVNKDGSIDFANFLNPKCVKNVFRSFYKGRSKK